MQYEEALRKWGKTKLEQQGRKVQERTVKVEMQFNEGFACCGGSDPNCYCSFAESPTADVVITGNLWTGGKVTHTISHYSFDFVTILKEIVTAAEGSITE